MNYVSSLTSFDFAGIFELDTAGTVLYTRMPQTTKLIDKRTDLIGQNFFEQVANFENIQDFRRRFQNFVGSRQSVENFLFECRFTDAVVPVRVLLVRARETSEAQTAGFVIVDIRRNI